ncbi:MAG: SDR family oxidoreductase [Gammaproteobacteria bacterium]|nr:SDR family oxidoreductase [Gammaproteobacteria bacterium]
MPDKILVMGATGTVGREVVTRLAGQGARVRAASRSPGMLAVPEDQVETISMDMRVPADLDRALEDVSKLFFLSPLDQSMPELAALVAERARANGVRHVVRLSTFGVDYPRKITLGKVHGEVEKIIRASGLAWTFLRPNAFMQNFITYWGGSIRENNAFFIPQGQGRVSLIDVRDIADAAVAVLTAGSHEGRVYELTGPEALSNYDIADTLGRVLEREIRYQDIPLDDARGALAKQGMSEWMIEVIIELFEMSAADEASEVTGAFEELTGRPPIDFDSFVRDYRHAFE